MSNFEIEGKYAIKAENGWKSGYDYDEVKRLYKTVITQRNTDYDGAIVEGFCVKDGQKLFSIKNVCLRKDGDGYCIIQRENGNYYIFFDETRKIHGPFYKITFEDDGIVVLKTIKCKDEEKKVYGLYSYYGDRILKTKYDELILRESLIIAKKKDNMGVYLYDGECTIPFNYDSIQLVCGEDDEDLLKVHSKTKGSFGVFSSEGQVIVPVKYSSVTYVSDAKVFVARQGNMYAIYDIDGYKIFPAIFYECTHIPKTPLLKVRLQDEIFYYDSSLKSLFQKECIEVCKNGYKFFDGKWNKVVYRIK